MPRVIDGTRRKDRRKKILSDTKGFRGSSGKLFRSAKDAQRRALQFAYRDRKARKRYFRSIWITRISAACRNLGINYSRFIAHLKSADIQMNRKVLAHLAVHDPSAFSKLVTQIQLKEK